MGSAFDGSTFDVRTFGAIGDGARHPLTERFGSKSPDSLTAAKAVYPFVTNLDDLDDEIDWAAIQATINQASVTTIREGGERGGTVLLPMGRYFCNRPLQLDNAIGIRFEGPGAVSMAISKSAVLAN